MSTVVGEVSMNVPEPFPLKGEEVEAKAAGKALRTTTRLMMVRMENFIAQNWTSHFLYKGSRS